MSAKCAQDFVFENFYISSAYRNKIAFVLTPSLLVKVFAAASTIDAETMHVRIQPSALQPSALCVTWHAQSNPRRAPINNVTRGHGISDVATFVCIEHVATVAASRAWNHLCVHTGTLQPILYIHMCT